MWLLLIKHWRLAGFGLLVLAFGLYVGALKLQMHSMSSRIDQLEAEIGKQSVALAERDALLDVQNRAVEGWKAAGIENAKLRQAAEKRAAALARTASETAVPVPPQSDPACLERDSWLRSELDSLLWR